VGSTSVYIQFINFIMMMHRLLVSTSSKTIATSRAATAAALAHVTKSPTIGAAFSTSNLDLATTTGTSSTNTTSTSQYGYHIEANNVARPGATQLTVSGPDVDGMLASMTVALAVKGCSLVELHAAKSVDCAMPVPVRGNTTNTNTTTTNNNNQGGGGESETITIKDIFTVICRKTGQAFPDDELEPLAKSLLESLRTPMNCLSVSGTMNKLEKTKDANLQHPSTPKEDQITIVPSSSE
jgi:hypothetical protein